MKRTAHAVLSISVLLGLLHEPLLAAQDDLANVSSEEIQLAGNPQQRYFLIGAKPDAQAPEAGYGLLLVLPGGDGSAEFNPFVKRIWQNALPEGYLVAQLVAVQSDKPNQIVWPTAKTRHPKQKFTTEDFIKAVVEDVKSKHKIDEDRIFALAWSSGGPAVYASTLTQGTPLRGAFVAMSVFIPARLPPLASAKDKRYFLLQSPDDQVTRMQFARLAKTQLTQAGAAVELKEYAGGHGWHGDIFGNIREGIEWLQRRGATSPAAAPPER